METPHRRHYPTWVRWLLTLLTLNLLLLTALLFRGPTLDQPPRAAADAEEFHRTLFARTIDDAARVSPELISRQLFALSDANPQLLWRKETDGAWVKVVAWMNEASFLRFYSDKLGDRAGATTPEGDPRVWVTLAPQVQNFCMQLRVDDQFSPAFRLKQYLGLDPNRRYDRFVELWVHPEDLFRPCPDPQTDDTACNLSLDPDNPPRVKGVADYPAFFEALKVQSYAPGGAPWTRLGYTYDWAFGERGVGASEYMLVPGARYWVDAAYTTDQYCGR